MALLIALPPSPVLAKSRKAEKFLKQGQQAEARKDWEKAVELYDKAVDADPGDAAYMMAARRARFQAAQRRVDSGQKLRSEGKLEEALAEFQKAILFDPASAIAIQEAKRTVEMMQGAPTKPEERGLTPADRARRDTEERVSRILEPPELKPTDRLPRNLTIRNQPVRILYETVAKLAGINVVFDAQAQIASRNYNLELNNATLDEAFDYLSVLTKTYWKPISTNTIFVTEDSVTKRRDYEDNVVKVFYVSNATSVQEFQEIATAIRSVTEIRRVFTYNAQKALIVRGTVDQVALAEKLVRDLDKPKAEVVIDVIVMEANSTRSRDWAATINSAGKAGLNIPLNFSPRTSVGGGGTGNGTPATPAISLSRLGHLSSADFTTTLPGALLNAILTDTSSRVLQSPQVRASDGMKVSLKIGDRIPYVTGSFSPLTGGVAGGLPYAQSQFQFIDTGVNVDITPQVHGNEEVTLHVEIDINSVRGSQDIGGLQQPIIQQRKNTADIRLREGEVNILGGLSQFQDSQSLSGIPGLVNIPALGKWLGSHTTDKERGSLLIALIPHIVRTPDYTAENLRGMYSGTDQTVKLSYAPKKDAGPLPNNVVPAPAPVTVPKPAETTTPKSESTTPPAPGAAVRPVFSPASVDTRVSGVFSMTVQVQDVKDLFSASSIKIKWDPALLRLNDISPGDLFLREGQRPTSIKDIRNDIGEATLTVSRLPGSTGVNGSGILATMTFLASGRGGGTVQVIDLGLKNTQLQAIPSTTAELAVKIQ
jgi:general secretion pathway protein D